jgi:hypothetical protein
MSVGLVGGFRFVIVTILGIFWALSTGISSLNAESGISSEQSNEILNRILEKNSNIFKKYKGVESIQRSLTQMFDSETGEVTESVELKTIQKSYFYEPSEVTVLEYKKNGEVLDPEDYKKDKRPPSYQIFGEKSRERFDIKVVGTRQMEGQNCYILNVLPKQDTDRHFKGTVFVDINSLKTVFLEGTIADYPFGLKDMKMRFSFRSLGELFVVKNSTIDLMIHVPIIKPNTRVLITIHYLESKPIPR